MPVGGWRNTRVVCCGGVEQYRYRSRITSIYYGSETNIVETNFTAVILLFCTFTFEMMDLWVLYQIPGQLSELKTDEKTNEETT